MIGASLGLDYFHSLILTQLPYNVTYICFYLPVYNLSSVFWRKNIVYNCKYSIYVLYYYYARWRI